MVVYPDFLMMSCKVNRPSVFLAVLFGIFSTTISLAQTNATPPSFDSYIGIYRLRPGNFVSVAQFDLGDGQNRLLFTDFKSGIVRILSPVSQNSFSAGPGLLMNQPVEMRFTFHRNKQDEVTGLVWERNGAARRTADKINLRREEVSFSNGLVTLSGTLTTPAPRGPHPAVVLLHGSGELNRYSFGPFPDFFLSRGFAVLAYDKRGTGRSNGNLNSSTFDDLAADGNAAVQFLKRRKGISPRRIGLCGASQGGFLAALVAAGNADIAFMINLYGMYVPAWQQELYRAEAEMRLDGLPEEEIAEALRFTRLEFEVGRTGQGWEGFSSAMQHAKGKKWLEYVPHSFADLNELRFYWRTQYSYDPAPALEKVTCPVLALFGELDKSTPVPQTITSMESALKKAGNPKFTYRLFPKGNHGLLESETGANSEIPGLRRFVPGLFDTMTTWLRQNHLFETRTSQQPPFIQDDCPRPFPSRPLDEDPFDEQ
jgi:pimeloyl-ACP methyl ester carboxylesterase